MIEIEGIAPEDEALIALFRAWRADIDSEPHPAMPALHGAPALFRVGGAA